MLSGSAERGLGFQDRSTRWWPVPGDDGWIGTRPAGGQYGGVGCAATEDTPVVTEKEVDGDCAFELGLPWADALSGSNSPTMSSPVSSTSARNFRTVKQSKGASARGDKLRKYGRQDRDFCRNLMQYEEGVLTF